MDSEDSTNPAHECKRIDLGSKECFPPTFPPLSSPPFERLEDNDDQLPASPSPDTPPSDPIQSISERARERYLREDLLALVLSPSAVECRQCKRKIKLSSKSPYDPFHWRNHRARCIKAHKRKVKTMNKASTSKKSLTPPLDARLSSLRTSNLVYTPPLSGDSDDGRFSDPFEEHVYSSTSSSSPASPKQELSPSPACSSLNAMLTFNDYLRRSHPDYTQPTASFPSAGRWRNWSWSQLKPPRFPVADDNYDDDIDEDPPKSFELPTDIFRWAAASPLSLVS